MWLLKYTILLLVVFVQSTKHCPKQKLIAPCRCLSRDLDQIQVWCSHSDLPRILDGLRALGDHLHKPIDELILENNQLPSMPGRAFLPLKVMRLMLRYNSLERLSSDWLTGLESSLMELFIVEPELRSLPEQSLINLRRLEAITIQTNLMKRAPNFSHLINLRYLLIQSTDLVELSPRHFRSLPSLERFNVAGSLHLERLEAGLLQDLPRVKVVNITNCALAWLHVRSLAHLPSLTELSLVGNKITDVAMIGRTVRALSSLETIHLDNNRIQRLDEASFVDLPSLREITLANNAIVELHHGAFHRVPHLHTINLNGNRVRRIHPESFLQSSGSGLEELWLVDNDISHVTELAALLDAVPRLKFLDMSGNRLDTVPFGALRGHAMLEQLHLDCNGIRNIDREAFVAMPALRELRLRNNTISDRLQMPFWNLPALKGLDLSLNHFKTIPALLLANLPSLRQVDLSSNNITFIESNVFLATSHLELLNISRNNLKTIHPSTLHHLTNLYELDISNNYLNEFITTIPSGLEKLHMQKNLIPHLPSADTPPMSLRYLDLSHNLIQTVSNRAFKSFPLLATLRLAGNSLYYLDELCFAGLQHLRVLNLEDNRLSEVKANVFQGLEQMHELNLRNNRLNLITHNLIKNVVNLTVLDVSNNQIDDIAPNAFDTTKNVRLLNLSHNSIVSLPISLYKLKKLKIIDLSNNRLKNISPDNLKHLINLEKLNLSNNYLKNIPTGTFTHLPNLQSLLLSDNEINQIDSKSIAHLPSLKSVDLSKNKLVEIPSMAFFQLPTLQQIHLERNAVRLISASAFVNVPHVLMLNLSANRLDSLDNAGLKGLPSLEMLDLSDNLVSEVHSDVFDKMEWLVELRLDDNGICFVWEEAFNKLPRLRVLTVRNNRLTAFPERAIDKLRGNLAVFDIDGNPLFCDCRLFWLRAWIQEASVIGPRCSDGFLLRDSRVSIDDCQSQQQTVKIPILPGCEINNATYNHLTAPNSEDFYDDYADYYPETSLQQISSSSAPLDHSKPVIYAATNKNKTHQSASKKKPPPKDITDSPSSSGFTFFGVPLPSLSLNNLLGNGRVDSSKTINRIKATNKSTPTPMQQQTAERKAAIVNNPPSRGVFYNKPASAVQLNPPELINGGFIPVLPGDGGFRPYQPETHEQAVVKKSANYNVSIEKVNKTTKPSKVATKPTTTTTKPLLTTTKPIDLLIYNEYSDDEDYPNENTTARIEEVKQISTTPATKFEDIFKEVVDNVSLPTHIQQTAAEDLLSSFSTNNNQQTNNSERQKTPLSTLLIPDGQQLTQNVRDSLTGHPTITKVANGIDALGTNIVAQPHNANNRAGKNQLLLPDGEFNGDSWSSTTEENWYFADYNKTNLIPYVGPVVNGDCWNKPRLFVQLIAAFCSVFLI